MGVEDCKSIKGRLGRSQKKIGSANMEVSNAR